MKKLSKTKKINKIRVLKTLVYVLLSLVFFSQIAFASSEEPLRQLVINKKLTGDYINGRIKLSSIKQNINTNFFPPKYKYLQRKKGHDKIYTLSRDYSTYGSLIIVKDAYSGKELKQISVARRVVKMVAHDNYLYVLCSGYFGSIWKIDTIRDIVVEKFTTSWNPTDMLIIDKYIYVSGGYIQIIDTKNKTACIPIQEYLDNFLTSYSEVSTALKPIEKIIGGKVIIDIEKLSEIQKKAIGENGLQYLLNHVQSIKIDLPSEYFIEYIKRISRVSFDTIALDGIDKNKNKILISYNLSNNKFSKSDNNFAKQENPTQLSLKVKYKLSTEVNPDSLIFVSSKNFDYISMISIAKEKVVGIIPVDAGVDDLIIPEGKNLLMAYHQLIGQVSIIDLTPGITQYSVIHRIISPKIRSDIVPYRLEMAQNADKIYLWNKDNKKIHASIDFNTDSFKITYKVLEILKEEGMGATKINSLKPLMNRKFETKELFEKSLPKILSYKDKTLVTKNSINIFYPIYDSNFVDVKLISPKEKVIVSQPSNRLFYLRKDEKSVSDIIESELYRFSLYTEEIAQSNKFPQKKKINKLGNKLGGIALSKDKRYLYITDSAQNSLLIVNTHSLEVIKNIYLGPCPTDILRIGKNKLFILNSTEGNVLIVDPEAKEDNEIKMLPIYAHNNNVSNKIIRLYDHDLNQTIELKFPFYTINSSKMVYTERMVY